MDFQIVCLWIQLQIDIIIIQVAQDINIKINKKL
jgi:hypothetical protein